MQDAHVEHRPGAAPLCLGLGKAGHVVLLAAFNGVPPVLDEGRGREKTETQETLENVGTQRHAGRWLPLRLIMKSLTFPSGPYPQGPESASVRPSILVTPQGCPAVEPPRPLACYGPWQPPSSHACQPRKKAGPILAKPCQTLWL